MARVAVPMTSLPAANVDGADVAVTLTTGDPTNDHVVEYPQAGDLVCSWDTGTTGNATSLNGYANKYGRPSTPAAVESDAGQTVTAGRLVVRYLADLDGLLNGSNQVELNVAQAYRVFAVRGSGKA